MKLLTHLVLASLFIVLPLQKDAVSQLSTTLKSVGPEGCYDIEGLHVSSTGQELFIECGSYSNAYHSFYSIDGGANWSILSEGLFSNTYNAVHFAIVGSRVYSALSENFSKANLAVANLSELSKGSDAFQTVESWDSIDKIFSANDLLYVFGLQSASPSSYDIAVYDPSTNSIIAKLSIPFTVTNSGFLDVFVSSANIFINVRPPSAGTGEYYYTFYDSTNHTIGDWIKLGSASGFPEGASASGVAVNSTTGDIYANSYDGVYISSDGGKSFAPIMALSGKWFGYGSATGDKIVLGSLISSDGGVSFQDLNDTVPSPNLLESSPIPVLNPADPSTLFISAEGALLKSDNVFSAPAWTKLNNGQLGQGIYEYIFLPDSELIVASSENGVAAGVSGGIWSAFTKADDENYFGLFTVLGSTVFAAFHEGIYSGKISSPITETSAISWTLLAKHPDNINTVSAMKVLGDNLLIAYNSGTAGNNDGLVLLNPTNGNIVRTALSGSQVTALEVIGSATIIAATEDAETTLGKGVFRSDDSGVTWVSFNKTSLPENINIESMLYDDAGDRLLLASQKDFFTNTNEPDLYILDSASVLPTADDYRSTGSGQFYDAEGYSYTRLSSVAVCEESANIFVAATINGGSECIFRSIDGGVSFSRYYCVNRGFIKHLDCQDNTLYLSKLGGFSDANTPATGDSAGGGIFTITADKSASDAKCILKKKATKKKRGRTQRFQFLLKDGKKRIADATVIFQTATDREFSDLVSTRTRSTNKKGRVAFQVRQGKSKLYLRAVTDYCVSKERVIKKIRKKKR